MPQPKKSNTKQSEAATEIIHRMSVFIEHHHPGFDLEAEAPNFYTNAEGDLVYIPEQGTATQEAATEPQAVEPEPEPAKVEAAPEPKTEAAPQPKPKTMAQEVLASGASTASDTKQKLDASEMGIQQYLQNVDTLVAQSKE